MINKVISRKQAVQNLNFLAQGKHPKRALPNAALGSYLIQHEGDAKLNRKLRKLKSPTWADQFLIDWTHRTRLLPTLRIALAKLDGVKTKDDLALRLEKHLFHGVLSLSEFGAICEAARWGAVLEASLIAADLIDHPSLQMVLSLYNRAGELHKLLETLYREMGRQSYQSGDLMFHFTEREIAFNNRAPSRSTRFTAPWVDGVQHVGVVFRDALGSTRSSEVTDTYHSRNYRVTHITGEVFRINVPHLLTVAGRARAQVLYGDEWEARVQERYKRLARLGHRRMTGRKPPYVFDNGPGRWIRLGPSSRITHKTRRHNDYEKYRHQFYDAHVETKHKDVLCSQFVAMSVSAALLQLERELHGKDASEATLLDLPFGERENLHTMMPARLLELLIDSGALDLVEPVGPLHNLLNLDTCP